MSASHHILSQISHRPYPLPKGNWTYYQEWNNALFLHWKVPIALLQPHVPGGLTIDLFEGNCYVSIVAFTMQKIRPRFLPSIQFISNFDEIKVRTYIDLNGKKGVYFLNIEAGSSLSVFISKLLSGLPYEKANIARTVNKYRSSNPLKNFSLQIEFINTEALTDKTELDKWLTERYCLFFNKGEHSYCYDIHHEEWKLQKVEIKSLKLNYKIGDLHLSEQPPMLIHYSKGVKVLAWNRQTNEDQSRLEKK